MSIVVREHKAVGLTYLALKPGDIFSWGMRQNWYILTVDNEYVHLGSGSTRPLKALEGIPDLIVSKATTLGVGV